MLEAYNIDDTNAGAVQQAPLYFVKAGVVRLPEYVGGQGFFVKENTSDIGTAGYYMSGLLAGGFMVDYLSFTDTNIFVGGTSSAQYANAGTSLRCVAR